VRYLCQVWIDGARLAALSRSEQLKLDRESMAYDEELRRSGHLILAQALQAPDSAVSIRFQESRLETTDGPFVETKEHLGGFLYIDARDLNEAVRIASGAPIAHFGGIEVRPVYDVNAAIARAEADGVTA
jgi:hypothetical protein